MSECKVLSVEDSAKEIVKLAKESLNEPTEKTEEETVTISKEEFNIMLATIEKANNRINELNDKFLRALADYQNLQRTSSITISNSKTNGKISVFKELLPIIDDFEKAKDAGELTEGVEFIYNKIVNMLKTNNIEVINPVEGDKFDDSIHEAIAVIPDSEDKKNTIKFTQNKGYKMNNTILRYAKVGVYV